MSASTFVASNRIRDAWTQVRGVAKARHGVDLSDERAELEGDLLVLQARVVDHDKYALSARVIALAWEHLLQTFGGECSASELARLFTVGEAVDHYLLSST